MTMGLSDQEIRSLIGASSEKRYEYWIKRVADLEEVWSLGDDSGWVLAADDDSTVGVPVWSHPEYAQACAEGEWAGNQPKAISLDDWLEKWLPGIARDNRMGSVFPIPDGKGVFVPPERVKEDLDEELENY